MEQSNRTSGCKAVGSIYWKFTHVHGNHSQFHISRVVRHIVQSSLQYFGEVTNQVTNLKSQFFFLCQVTNVQYNSLAINISNSQSHMNYTAHFGDLKQKIWWFELVTWWVTSSKNWWLEWTARLSLSILINIWSAKLTERWYTLEQGKHLQEKKIIFGLPFLQCRRQHWLLESCWHHYHHHLVNKDE